MAPSLLPERLRADGSLEKLPAAPAREAEKEGLPPMEIRELEVTPEVRAVPPMPFFRPTKEMKLTDVAGGRITLESITAPLPL